MQLHDTLHQKAALESKVLSNYTQTWSIKPYRSKPRHAAQKIVIFQLKGRTFLPFILAVLNTFVARQPENVLCAILF